MVLHVHNTGNAIVPNLCAVRRFCNSMTSPSTDTPWETSIVQRRMHHQHWLTSGLYRLLCSIIGATSAGRSLGLSSRCEPAPGSQ